MTKTKENLKKGDIVYIIKPKERCDNNPNYILQRTDYNDFFADIVLECEFLSEDFHRESFYILYNKVVIEVYEEFLFLTEEDAERKIKQLNLYQHADNMRRIIQLENKLERITKALKSI